MIYGVTIWPHYSEFVLYAGVRPLDGGAAVKVWQSISIHTTFQINSFHTNIIIDVGPIRVGETLNAWYLYDSIRVLTFRSNWCERRKKMQFTWLFQNNVGAIYARDMHSFRPCRCIYGGKTEIVNWIDCCSVHLEIEQIKSVPISNALSLPSKCSPAFSCSRLCSLAFTTRVEPILNSGCNKPAYWNHCGHQWNILISLDPNRHDYMTKI